MDEKLVALHGHFLAADAIKQFLFADVPVDEEVAAKLGEEGMSLAQFWSGALRLQVFYALIYVVVEGYLELGYQDPAVDPLLAQSLYLDSFKRFRNAFFHYQGKLISPPRERELDLRTVAGNQGLLREASVNQGVVRRPSERR